MLGVLTADFFISYASADRAWAEWIAWQLEDRSYSTVIQAWDFRPGHNFVLEMQSAATHCERTIAVLSPSFLESRFAAAEWASAFAVDPSGEQRPLIPVRVRDCDPHGLLGQIVYLDLVGRSEISASEALLDGVRVDPVGPRRPQKQRHSTASRSDAPAFPGGTAVVEQQTRPLPSVRGRIDPLALWIKMMIGGKVTAGEAIRSMVEEAYGPDHRYARAVRRALRD
jgi:hypothetical protein